VIEPLVLCGRLVTFDERGVVEDGALYIGADERIAAVRERRASPPAGFEEARRVETAGTIYPGLIDLHNHIAYNVISLWASPARGEPWTRRDQWPRDPSYKPEISLPTKALCQAAGEAVLKYVEAKAVIGGVTAVQGSAKVPNYEGWLVRNVEKETFQTGKVTVRQSVRELGERDFAGYRESMEAGMGFLYHLAEGSDPGLEEEFEALREHDCLHERLIAIHATALERPHFEEWAAHGAGSVVWSPFSNLWLYGQTTRVVEARNAGIRICLGADWSPSGTKNLLGELKVADLYDREVLAGALGAEEICRMATSNPAEAAGWEGRLGRLREGLHADVLVTSTRERDPYRNLISARERDVWLVTINGQPIYGTTALVRSAGGVHAEPIGVGRLRRSIVLVYPDVPNADMSWREVMEELHRARADPLAHEQERAGRRPGGELVRVEPEKPWEGSAGLDAVTLRETAVPRLDALFHDRAFFNSLARFGFHAGRLEGLREYYSA